MYQKYFFKKFLRLVPVTFFSFVFTYNAVAQTLIVALGDSLTEGFGVSKEEAYPYLVEQELMSKGHSVKIELILI